MSAVAVLLRVTIFLAIVVPVLVWVVRRARAAHEVPPSDDSGAGHREGESLRGHWGAGGWGGGTH
jgi:hypothetical protein